MTLSEKEEQYSPCCSGQLRSWIVEATKLFLPNAKKSYRFSNAYAALNSEGVESSYSARTLCVENREGYTSS